MNYSIQRGASSDEYRDYIANSAMSVLAQHKPSMIGQYNADSIRSMITPLQLMAYQGAVEEDVTGNGQPLMLAEYDATLALLEELGLLTEDERTAATDWMLDNIG